jgi:ribonuclease J
MGSEEFFSRMANIFGTLKKVVKKLKPGKIIPIHTFHPDKYGGLFSQKIEQVSDGEVFVV